jgi:hypothetical protein
MPGIGGIPGGASIPPGGIIGFGIIDPGGPPIGIPPGCCCTMFNGTLLLIIRAAAYGLPGGEYLYGAAIGTFVP